jgi:hypothetical protein
MRMRVRRLVSAAAAAAAVLLTVPPGALAAPDRTGSVTPATPFTWQGAVATGANQDYDPQSGEPCGKTPETYCDVTLVNVQAGDFYETSGGGVEFSIGGSAGNDLDLYVYESDAAGTRGQLVGASAGATDVENTAILDANGYYLVQVVYWDVDNAGYSGRAEFFRRAKFPPDVDNPRGLQDTLASDPSKGFKSHSEMHEAQSPLDPKVLVAGSKFYNRDRDSLEEYEFKNGTYVSFNRGRRWFDLGQTGVCPPSQAPPSSWPFNDCYPDEDPNRGGDEEDDRGTGDFGEEYITSDPWVDFDDEGNAYFMVLDSPPFPSGAGWGMSLHRWESVSRRDVRRGRSWGPSIAINEYETAAEQELFLDDKNTFVVNNAGRDGDGRTGIMVACWGQNGPVFADRGPQQVVCERSTDGGRSWPDEPTPVSPGLQRLVIAPHVVADTRDENTFYVVWLEYLSEFLPETAGTNTYYFSKSTDGGRTWSAATPVQTIRPLPNTFPRQAFRNLSIPIMAVGPNSELYLTYADYNPAAAPTPDEDGQQADIKLKVSRDGGTTWTAPVRVNQDRTNADQFQPYVRATKRGQVNVSFFDRRLDRPNPPLHPGNFFIDTFLARSNDGGVTWGETRVSHDSWDPSINPPISGSGEFIGDYQGLVADDCAAIPFENNTHLANDPGRDPDFDRRHPRSPYQEAFSWLVPNTKAFGGLRPRGCGDDHHHRDDDGHHGDDDRRADSPADQAAAAAARRSARTLSGYSGAATRAIGRGYAKILGLDVK